MDVFRCELDDASWQETHGYAKAEGKRVTSFPQATTLVTFLQIPFFTFFEFFFLFLPHGFFCRSANDHRVLYGKERAAV